MTQLHFSTTPKSYQSNNNYPQRVKLWSMVGLAAIQNKKGSAWRCWVLAHALDSKGSGKVSKEELKDYLAFLGVHRRSVYRWLAAAVKQKLFSEYTNEQGEVFYYLKGLEKAAKLLCVTRIGKPATVDAVNLVRCGWGAYVWAAFLATLKGRPVSQEVKEHITGITARTQRKYQAAIPGNAIKNFAERPSLPLNRATLAQGTKANGNYCFINYRRKVVQRFPDIRVVPTADLARNGRSRKVQKLLNDSSSLFLDRGKSGRIFHDTHKSQKAAAKATDPPPEMYVLQKANGKVNWWEVVTLEAEI